MSVLHGCSLEVLKTFADNSVDSVVTDPPYGLKFMNKHWDYDVPSVELWREVFRVLKPGGHLLSFGGTRTYHRMAVSIEDAGFEIRDQIQWLYGSGFPKSLDISKAIDKAAGAKRDVIGENQNTSGRQSKINRTSDYGGFTQVLNDNITAPSTDDAKKWQGFGTALKPANEPIVLARKPISEKTVASNVLKHGTGGLNIDKSRIPANQVSWEEERSLCSTCAQRVENDAKHSTQVTRESCALSNAATLDSEKGSLNPQGTSKAGIGCLDGMKTVDTSTSLSIDIFGNVMLGQSQPDTLSTTPTKISRTTDLAICSSCEKPIMQATITKAKSTGLKLEQRSQPPVGRFPSNVILGCACEADHEPDCAVAELDRQSGLSKSPNTYTHNANGLNANSYGQGIGELSGKQSLNFGDTGGASRFFYCAKTSKAERNAGLEGMPEQACTTKQQNSVGRMENGAVTNTRPGEPKSANHHPTVKPVKLMSYLITLITPPEGTVLDPFCGSGSTGVAAIKLGFQFIGIERELEYVEIARRRIDHAR